jgi:small subunit ribosomal protein S3
MGQKIHPLGFRLGITQKHRSQWFAKTQNYPRLLLEDLFLRETILKRFNNAGISTIEIQRKLDQIQIEIRTSQPKRIIGRGKVIMTKLRDDLEKELRISRIRQEKPPAKIGMYVTTISKPFSEAALIGEFLVEQLEKRVAFRQALRKALKQVKKAGIKGIKIQISGRLNGAEIARTEWVRQGRVPLQTLRADINYSYRTAKTIYGILGIKVWTFNGEVNE